ncbi:MAG: hypothetical protein U5L09_12550 [Bacteroidales bacterium]|nr:hypothetical protein [Bacteroidales bacterium]
MTYKGASVEKQQNTSSNASFDFYTVNVTASLINPEPVMMNQMLAGNIDMAGEVIIHLIITEKNYFR